MFQPFAPWRSLSVGTSGEIDVRLEHLPKASIATVDWLRWKVVHSGAHAIQPEKVSARIEAQLFDGKTWQRVNNNSFLISPISQVGVELQPGVHRIALPAARQTMLSLRLPSRDGWLVRCRLHLSMELPSGGSIATPSAGLPFEFEWLYPTPIEIDTTRKHLRELLALPGQTPAGAHLVDVLLLMPLVRAGISLTEITTAMEGAQRYGRQCREILARRVHDLDVSRHQLVDYFAKRLQDDSPHVCEDLMHAPRDFWDLAFLEPLLQMYELGETSGRSDSLRVLDRHGMRWRSNQSACERLYDTIMSREGEWLGVGLGELATAHPELHRMGIVSNWQQAVRNVAVSRHHNAIDILRPYLGDTSILCAQRTKDGRYIDGLRACDVALEAILKVRYGEVHAGYDAVDGPGSSRPSGRGGVTRDLPDEEVRDNTIRKLLIELDK